MCLRIPLFDLARPVDRFLGDVQSGGPLLVSLLELRPSILVSHVVLYVVRAWRDRQDGWRGHGDPAGMAEDDRHALRAPVWVVGVREHGLCRLVVSAVPSPCSTVAARILPEDLLDLREVWPDSESPAAKAIDRPPPTEHGAVACVDH